ncbi:MAG TPA: leucine--tRNA ligase [Candidatus Limnocylindria bacterium]|nr:leucine--tRNA ligase [Candidatus Limnocylindria bacterium]
MKRYVPKDIEPKWQKTWEEQGIYEASEDPGKPKRYVLEYFPYPSGAAMHVGHVRNYTIGDAVSRFNRMQGFNVLHPMGWDAFGLPAENYAIKTGISPRQAVDQNTARFKKQLTQMGFGYDWSREIDSTDPSYYRWTQWFFLLLFKRGLAYQQESLQWWCPVDKTVLANEQVEAGKCWRCGNEVEKKALKQWFFKITDYADRLAKDLDDVNWSDGIKQMQRNWIGRSKGAEVDFKVDEHDETLRIFTTRPDTLFGATFMVLAPEHPLVKVVTTDAQKGDVEKYVKSAQAKSDVERQETDREKTGVFTGAYAINPVNDEKIPIWIADYVLMGYGTGAIMAVPGHDQRDFDFARKFQLPIKYVVEPVFGEPQGDEAYKDSVIVAVRNPEDNTVIVLDWGPRQARHGGNMLIGGGIDQGEDPIECAKREIAEETGYTDVAFVKQSDFIGHGYFHSDVKNKNIYTKCIGMLFDLKSDKKVAQKLDDGEKDKFKVTWQPREKVADLLDDGIHEALYRHLLLNETYHGEGLMVGSGNYDGQPSSEVREKLVADLAARKLGQEQVNYKMRDWLISRQRYWGAPIPIIHCPTDGAVAVPEDQLPVVLPPVESYEPSGDGRSPLANVPEFVNTTCPKCGGPSQRETDTMDGFACSSWYFLRFADPHNDKEPFSKEKAKFWLPVDDYIGGAEHAVMHLLYARFWTKVMYDEGLIDFQEPFKTLRNHGMILAPDGAKMSKSKGNTIEPDGLIEQGYGADSIRIMELFIGPWNQVAAWSVEGLGGSHRFLQRVWTLVQEVVEDKKLAPDTREEPAARQALVLAHQTTKRVTEDLQDLGLNTAIARLMESVNGLYRLKGSMSLQLKSPEWLEATTTLLKLLAPFAPHITEELWQQLGQEGSIHTSEWPKWDEKYLTKDTLNIVVQVNGKVRANVEVPADASEETVLEAAKANEKVAGYIKDGIKKSIYVPKKLVNFVV